MNDETSQQPDERNASSKQVVGGGLGLAIAACAGVLGMTLAVFLAENKTPGWILGSGIAAFLITLPILGFINRVGAQQAKATEEKTKKDQEDYLRAEEEREELRREERERELASNLAPFHDFGFRHHSIEKSLAEAGRSDPETGDLPFLPDVLAAGLLKEGTAARETIERLLPAIREQSVTHNEILSFGFSTALIPMLRGLNSEEFRRAMNRSLVSELQKICSKDGDIVSGSEDAIRFEVLLIPELPREVILTGRKSNMKMEQMVHYQILPMLDDWEELDTERRPFSLWDQLPSGSWRETPAPYFYGGEDSTITIGPKLELGKRGDRFHSALVDFWTDRIDHGRTLPIEDLAQDEKLQRVLGIKVTRQTDPYRASNVYQYDRKGFVEVVGWFLDQKWEPWAGKEEETPFLTSMLNVSAPNILVLPHAAAFRVESTDQNKLLANFLGTDLGPRRNAVFSQGGNFEIQRGPVSYGSKIHTYFIRLAENASVTKFLKPTPGAPDQFQDFDAYHDFPSPRAGFSPLEDRGFSSVPASDCYFRTGNESVQLVLKVNLGSPAPGETERGVSYSNSQLRAALSNFAKRQGINGLEIYEEESAQGLVSRGFRPNEDGSTEVPVWVKLLDPTHADFFASGRLVETLLEASILPGEIGIHRVDTYGKTQTGMIPVFTMPEYLSVEQYLETAETKDATRNQEVAAQLSTRLEQFVRRCMGRNLLCTDFTLADTFFPVPREGVLSFLQESAQLDDQPGLFVGDFGSYRESIAFERGSSVTREQYRPPEDLNTSLKYAAEPYSVYLLGLLLAEVHSFSPGLTLESVMQLRMGLDEESYTVRLREEIEKSLAETDKQIVDRIVAMLAYRPENRPMLFTT